MDRRAFLSAIAGAAGALSCSSALGAAGPVAVPAPPARPPYRGPNVIVIRFGGGARRRETIDPDHTLSPFLARELVPRGTLYRRMEIAQLAGLNTSHGEGTLNILTGRYDQYRDVDGRFLGARFEPKVPTLFEYVRKAFAVAPHETLIVNGEDRPDEEFYTFSNHLAYGIDYRCSMLSLYRFKAWRLARQIDQGQLSTKALDQKRRELAKWSRADRRIRGQDLQGPELERFWERWTAHYGESGLVNPRGDRLLTELTVRALAELRPRLIMVNYQDCDYVHWGYLSHYTRAVAIMDEGLQRIVAAAQADEAYRNNTLFVIAPDCGRDSNPFADVPCQHHFNSRSAHEVFALFFGHGVAPGQMIDRRVDQTQIPATIGRLAGFTTEHAEARVLEEAIA